MDSGAAKRQHSGRESVYHRRMRFIACIAAALAMLSGCGKKAPPPAPAPVLQRDLGASCQDTSECREGLACIEEHCAPATAGRAKKELERAYEMGQEQTDKAIEQADRPSAP